MKQLLSLYQQLDSEALACLENICLHPGRLAWMDGRQLASLVELELLECAGSRGWVATRLGRGVVNWHKQTREASQRSLQASEPRAGENGEQPGPPCDEFRELLFSGVYCWCGRLRSEHCAEVVLTAQRMLAYRERILRWGPLRTRVTGRAFKWLADQIPSELRHLLSQLDSSGVTLPELRHKLGHEVGLPAVQQGVTYLAAMDLAYLEEESLLWFPSWDGSGLKIWLQERFVHEALQEVLPEVRPGEDGTSVLPEVCDSFRPLLSRGGDSCWCGHLFSAHSA